VWERLEPVARNYDMTETLRAEVHDPLWALTRQWQLGEFEGHDGGSPVDVAVSYYRDPISTVEIAGEPDSYDPKRHGPLEAVVEKEPVATDGPNHRLRLETGMNFLDRLRREARAADRELPRLEQFDGTFKLDLSDDHLDADARRFEHVVASAPGDDDADADADTDTEADADTRALDGYAVFAALDDHVWNAASGSFEWSSADAGDLPVPDVWNAIPTAFEDAAEGFHAWYRDLYDEPESAATDAWQEDRLEYEFAIETSGNGTTTRFEAAEYTGGRLDWDDFTVASGTDSDGPSPTTTSKLPTRITFRGMPKPRYWTLEDRSVNFDEISAATEDVGWLTMIEIGLLAGTDWYTFPLETDYGTLVRVTNLDVWDTFDEPTSVPVETPIEPSSDGSQPGAGEKGWNTFLFDLPHRPEPGLLVPPVLGPASQSDPVERVRFTRDETANLVFALENLVEGPLGDPLDRAEFEPARVEVSDVVPSDDPDSEYIELENPGDDSVDVTGWRIDVEVDPTAGGSFSFDGTRPGPDDTLTVHTFGAVEIGPRSRLRLYTGGFATQNTDDERFIGADESLWARSEALVSYQLHTDTDAADTDTDDADTDTSSERTLVLEQPAGTVSPSSLPRYRLASDVPDHWFPLKTDPTAPDDYVLRVALMLDADTLSDTIHKVPNPLGEVLTKDAAIHEEEITRQGTEVVRRYQLASGNDGRTHVWSGRNVSVGGGEESSGLRFDLLDDAEPADSGE
jgi:hypothetical protein